jgi:hypothetical protein
LPGVELGVPPALELPLPPLVVARDVEPPASSDSDTTLPPHAAQATTRAAVKRAPITGGARSSRRRAWPECIVISPGEWPPAYVSVTTFRWASAPRARGPRSHRARVDPVFDQRDLRVAERGASARHSSPAGLGAGDLLVKEAHGGVPGIDAEDAPACRLHGWHHEIGQGENVSPPRGGQGGGAGAMARR